MNNTREKEVERRLYELMDSFMVESKDQHGNDRTIDRLNRDRHLFIKNAMQLIMEEVRAGSAEQLLKAADAVEFAYESVGRPARLIAKDLRNRANELQLSEEQL